MKKNRELDAVKHELSLCGITPVITNGGKHIKVKWAVEGRSRCYVVPCSGSDFRGARNARATVRKQLRADGLIVPVAKARAA